MGNFQMRYMYIYDDILCLVKKGRLYKINIWKKNNRTILQIRSLKLQQHILFASNSLAGPYNFVVDLLFRFKNQRKYKNHSSRVKVY